MNECGYFPSNGFQWKTHIEMTFHMLIWCEKSTFFWLYYIALMWKKVNSMKVFHWNPFGGKYSHSFNDLFLRVYDLQATGTWIPVVALCGCLPNYNAGHFSCRVLLRDTLSGTPYKCGAFTGVNVVLKCVHLLIVFYEWKDVCSFKRTISIPCTFPHSMADRWIFADVLHCHDGKADC